MQPKFGKQIFGPMLPALVLATAGCHHGQSTTDAGAQDEAVRSGLSDDHFKHAADNYFHDMDNGVALTTAEVQGRNMWLVWTGGDDRFWDTMSRPTFGAFDLLKIIAPDPAGPNRRQNRWQQLGLVNEPCFAPPTHPDQYGLWRDQRSTACAPDPFADEKRYPGVKIGARGQTVPVGSYYG